MRGRVYIDPETHQVMRFSYEAEGIPTDWPVVATPAVVEYGFAEIAGAKFLLPLHVDSRVIFRNDQVRNVTDFGDYRKFSSETTVTFGK